MIRSEIRLLVRLITREYRLLSASNMAEQHVRECTHCHIGNASLGLLINKKIDI